MASGTSELPISVENKRGHVASYPANSLYGCFTGYRLLEFRETTIFTEEFVEVSPSFCAVSQLICQVGVERSMKLVSVADCQGSPLDEEFKKPMESELLQSIIRKWTPYVKGKKQTRSRIKKIIAYNRSVLDAFEMLNDFHLLRMFYSSPDFREQILAAKALILRKFVFQGGNFSWRNDITTPLFPGMWVYALKVQPNPEMGPDQLDLISFNSSMDVVIRR